ncbi:MAG: metallophosphoesterase [Solirubrobacterales bacterium]|nr:metallophosphoesterase [Solirubrobacterales bacterium]
MIDSPAKILKWLCAAGLAIALVAGGTVAGWRLAGSAKEPTAIGRVSIEVQPSLSGDVEAFLPVADWGVRADAFDAPIRIRAELQSVNRKALLRAANGDRSIADQTEAGLRSATRSALLRATAWGLAVVLVLLVVATLLWRGLRPRWLILAIGTVVTVLLYGGSAYRLQSTFDSTAFDSPTYFAQGDEIGRILDLTNQARIQTGYGNEYSAIVRSISSVLEVGREQDAPGVDFYEGSDLHANALVIDPIAELVGQSPLLLTGDFGQRGNEVETRLLAPRVAALGEQVVAVSGNHDTTSLMKRLSGEGVTVLDRKGRLKPSGSFEPPPVIEVHGTLIAGYGDPLEYRGGDPDSTDRPITSDDISDPDVTLRKWRKDLVGWFGSLKVKPDLVMVHKSSLAQYLARTLDASGYGRHLTITSGHDHEQHVDRFGRIVIVDGGTLGAGGVFDSGEADIGIARLHFDEDRVLVSVDLIAVEPLSGAARASRVVIATLCPEEPRCRFEPGSGSEEVDP